VPGSWTTCTVGTAVGLFVGVGVAVAVAMGDGVGVGFVAQVP
jgi:hypothetical protein